MLNQKRFLALDLTYGYPIRVSMYEYLLDNGMTREEYHWFAGHQVKAHCILGNDYYVTNEHLVRRDGTVVGAGEIFGYYVITHQYFQRYHLPVMHTETNLGDPVRAPEWLRKQWANINRLAPRRRAGRRLHVVQPDGPGRLGFGASRRRRARGGVRLVRPRPPPAPSRRGLP